MFVRVWDHTKCLLKRGVRLRNVKNVVFCGWDHTKCLLLTMTKCPLKEG